MSLKKTNQAAWSFSSSSSSHRNIGGSIPKPTKVRAEVQPGVHRGSTAQTGCLKGINQPVNQ